jgi:hypothetical protein
MVESDVMLLMVEGGLHSAERREGIRHGGGKRTPFLAPTNAQLWSRAVSFVEWRWCSPGMPESENWGQSGLGVMIVGGGGSGMMCGETEWYERNAEKGGDQ